MKFRSVLALSCCLTLAGCAGGPRGGGAPFGLFALGAGVVIGSVLTSLPPRHDRIRDDIYYSDGVYYRNAPDGYVVVVPPRGVWVDDLPPERKVVRYQDHDYYKCKGIWYRFDPKRHQYRVIDAPF